MSGNSELSDKALLREYCIKKGVSFHKFAKDLGFSNSFLNREGGITATNLRMIRKHPNYSDLNTDAFLDGDTENLIKAKGQLYEGIANQKFIIESFKLISEAKNNKENARLLMEICLKLEQSLEMLSTLSKEYTALYADYQQAAEALKKELGIK